MRLTSIVPIIALLLLPVAGRAQSRSSDSTFNWEGSVAAGSWVRVRSMNGEIRVEASSGNRVQIVATKRWRHGDPSAVRIELTRTGTGSQDVLVCALWNEGSCSETSYHGSSHDNDVSVDFVVRLPRGVRIDARTTNGDIAIHGATTEVEAHTTNGSIDATTETGPVNASTTNGNIDARMSALGAAGEMRYRTVNGNVTVTLPAQLDADVDMSTVNGSLEADYPITLQGSINRRHIRATIGRGGRGLEFRTVNGDVRLVKHG